MSEWKRSTSCTGGACVEVAYRRSSYCANGACVEVGWRTSSYSGGNGCVEVGHELGRVLVRDSKSPGEPISFMPQTWMSTVLAPVMLGRLPAFVEPAGDGYVWSGYSVDGEFLRLHFNAEEWSAFGEGVKAGEFNVEALTA